MKKIKASICLLIICISIPFVAYAAYTYPEGGALRFDGGQSDTRVYSDIKDNKNNLEGSGQDDGKNYGVLAIVKVGSTSYDSGWKIAQASTAADRVWYANESSSYDFEIISTKYTYANWGTSY